MGRIALLACPEGGTNLSAMAGLDRSSFNTEPGLRSISFSTFMALGAAAATRRLFLFLQVFPPVFQLLLFVWGRLWYTMSTNPGPCSWFFDQNRQDVKSSDERWFFESRSPLPRPAGGGLRV